MPVPESAHALRKLSLRDTVYETIHEWIIDGTLEPGERVRDSDVADSLGVSRTPVREALQQLSQEGLVETSAGRQTRVAALNLAEADRLYPIVWSLDSLAARLGADKLARAELREMKSANAQLAKALRANDAQAAINADAGFHHVLAIASGNPDLQKLLGWMRVRLHRLELAYFSAGLAKSSVDEHAEILAALEAQDIDRAVAAIEENWKCSLRRFRVNAPRSREG